MYLFIKIAFWASLLAFAWALYKGDTLPSPDGLLKALQNEPIQTPLQAPPFKTTVNDITYDIKPLYRYELWGLVVSKHHADSFIDYTHKAWGDHLNVVDICVVWGKNAFSGVYEKLEFSSGQWTCYTKANDRESWEQFSNEAISNNHILADQGSIKRLLKQVRIGDQIHLRGYLAEYSHSGFSRGTSTVRTDTGNGACETIFVEWFDILKRGPRHWQVLRWAAGLALLFSVIVWWRLPDRLHVRH